MLGLITESFGISSSTLAFLRIGLIDKKIAIRSLATAIPFVIGASALSFFIPESFIYLIISIVLLVGVYTLLNTERIKAFADEMASKKKNLTITYKHKKLPENVILTDRYGKTYNYCRCNYKIRTFGYSLGGFFQGISGFGIGEMGVISMIASGIPAKVGTGSNHIAGTSVSGDSQIPWNIIAITVPAVIIGGQVAPYVAAKLDTTIMEKVLSIVFVVLAFALLYIGFR